MPKDDFSCWTICVYNQPVMLMFFISVWQETPHELNPSMFIEKNSRASVLCHAPKRWREQLQNEETVRTGLSCNRRVPQTHWEMLDSFSQRGVSLLLSLLNLVKGKVYSLTQIAEQSIQLFPMVGVAMSVRLFCLYIPSEWYLKSQHQPDVLITCYQVIYSS